MPIKILIQFAQAHSEFRIPELTSVAQIYGVDIALPPNPDVTRPFMVVEVQQEEHARLLAQRCILVKFVDVIFFTLLTESNRIFADPCTNSTLQVHLIASYIQSTRPKHTYGRLIKKHRGSLW